MLCPRVRTGNCLLRAECVKNSEIKWRVVQKTCRVCFHPNTYSIVIIDNLQRRDTHLKVSLFIIWFLRLFRSHCWSPGAPGLSRGENRVYLLSILRLNWLLNIKRSSSRLYRNLYWFSFSTIDSPGYSTSSLTYVSIRRNVSPMHLSFVYRIVRRLDRRYSIHMTKYTGRSNWGTCTPFILIL